MKRLLIILTIGFLFIVTGSQATPAQTLQDHSLRLNGAIVKISPYAQGRATTEGFIRVLSFSRGRQAVLDKTNDTLEMALINDQTGIYVAYAIHIELIENSTKLKLTIKPPDIEGIKNMRESIWIKKMAERWPNLDRKTYAPSPLPGYPPPSVINLADQIRLPLWKNDETGAVIGDMLSFALDEPVQAHDFSLDDVMFKMADFQLRINGKVRSGTIRFGKFSGSLPWVYVPGKGRFIFSLQPHVGFDFRKAALLEDSKISFKAGDDLCEWFSDELILSQRGKWHLWVLHDKDFKGDEQSLRDTQLISPGNCCLYGAFGGASVLPKPNQ